MNPYHHRTLFVGDIKTHLLEVGSGPDLVLLHGGEYGASAEITWKHNVGSLAERFHETDKIYNFSDPAGHRLRHIKRFLEVMGIKSAFARLRSPVHQTRSTTDEIQKKAFPAPHPASHCLLRA